MITARRLHLEIQRRGKKAYGVIHSSFRQGEKVRHSNHGRLTGLPLEQPKLIQAAFRGDVVPKEHAETLQLLGSREFGASAAILALARDLGLDKAIYSRPGQWARVHAAQ